MVKRLLLVIGKGMFLQADEDCAERHLHLPVGHTVDQGLIAFYHPCTIHTIVVFDIWHTNFPRQGKGAPGQQEQVHDMSPQGTRLGHDALDISDAILGARYGADVGGVPEGTAGIDRGEEADPFDGL